MRDISNTTGLDSYGEIPGQAGGSTKPSAGKEFYQGLIWKANKVPLGLVFKHYGLQLNDYDRKIICPFKSHQGGRESSGSFTFYPHTNSYCCYGCRQGSHAVDFVSIIDNITKSQAATKILKLFNGDLDESACLDVEDFSKKLEIMMDLSNVVREFRQNFIDEKSGVFIENICMLYDDMNLKHKNLDNEALSSIIEDLKDKILSYSI
jgi:DNA primase